MTNKKELSEKGIELIKRWEGCRTTVYKDVANLLTVGIGHLCKPHEGFRLGQSISLEQVHELFRADVKRFVDSVNKTLENVELTQNQFDACVSLAYNIGTNAFAGSSVVRHLKKGNYELAANAFLAWNKATVKGQLRKVQGLINRREDEKKYFLSKK